MSLAVIDPIEDNIFEDVNVCVLEPAHEGYLAVDILCGDYSFFYKDCSRQTFNILMFTDDTDLENRYIIGNADEIDEVMKLAKGDGSGRVQR